MSDLERTIQGLQNELDNLPDPSDIQVQTYMFSYIYRTYSKIMLFQSISKNSSFKSFIDILSFYNIWLASEIASHHLPVDLIITSQRAIFS